MKFSTGDFSGTDHSVARADWRSELTENERVRNMSQPKKLWLSRDEFVSVAPCVLWTTEPRKNVFGVFCSTGKWCRLIDDFCPKLFESITGFSLSPGECKRVTLEIKLT